MRTACVTIFIAGGTGSPTISELNRRLLSLSQVKSVTEDFFLHKGNLLCGVDYLVLEEVTCLVVPWETNFLLLPETKSKSLRPLEEKQNLLFPGLSVLLFHVIPH